jgi:hypothetical protein
MRIGVDNADLAQAAEHQAVDRLGGQVAFSLRPEVSSAKGADPRNVDRRMPTVVGREDLLASRQ